MDDLTTYCQNIITDNKNLAIAFKSGRQSAIGTLTGIAMKGCKNKYKAADVLNKLKELIQG